MTPSQKLFHEATALFWTGGNGDTIHELVRKALSEREYEELEAENGGNQ